MMLVLLTLVLLLLSFVWSHYFPPLPSFSSSHSLLLCSSLLYIFPCLLSSPPLLLLTSFVLSCVRVQSYFSSWSPDVVLFSFVSAIFLLLSCLLFLVPSSGSPPPYFHISLGSVIIIVLASIFVILLLAFLSVLVLLVFTSASLSVSPHKSS